MPNERKCFAGESICQECIVKQVFRYAFGRVETPADRELAPHTDTLMAEVTHAVCNEMAMHLEDVALRRTDLASASHPGARTLDAVAARMQQLLGWSDRRRMEELNQTDAVLRRHHAVAVRPPAEPLLDSQAQYAT